jgi:hypothetical protein
MGLRRKTLALAALAAGFSLLGGSGCYHYTWDLHSAAQPGSATPASEPAATVTYEERSPTFFNGFVGNGRMNTARYCADPLRVELRVTAIDVLLSVATLLVYTPHTLYVVCKAPAVSAGTPVP